MSDPKKIDEDIEKELRQGLVELEDHLNSRDEGGKPVKPPPKKPPPLDGIIPKKEKEKT